MDPLRHHRAHRNETHGLGSRVAGRIAEGIGTVQFLAVALALIVAWVLINGGYGFFAGAIRAVIHGRSFDPAPWIFLNLIFSFEAFFTGSLVVIAQKTQNQRDHAREEADAKHREEIAEQHAAQLNTNTELTRQVHDLARQIHDRVGR